MATIKYHEIFASIQGESTDTGRPCVFVRLFGCNVKCAYCDQPQTKSDCKKVTLEKLLDDIRKFGIHYVCITGGEPLLQQEVYVIIHELISWGYEVSIETNGTVPLDCDPPLRRYKYVMDVKCPSSKVSSKNCLDNLDKLSVQDEVKFVIADREDYDYAKRVLWQHHTKAKILFSPMFEKDNTTKVGPQLCEWLIQDRIHNARIQIQIHKMLGVM